MILLNKYIKKQTKIYPSAIIILLLCLPIKAQDLRNLEHSIKFANYLFDSHQFALSSEEFERVLFLDSGNNEAILKLLKSYRLSGKSNIANKRFNDIFKSNIYEANSDISKEYVANLILNKKFRQTYNYLENNNKFNKVYKNTYQLGCLLLQNKREDAFAFAKKNMDTNDPKNLAMHLLALDYKNTKYKKPALAAIYSAIIPGVGKVYCKNWKDGLISLLFVSVNAWQAQRGFQKYGNNSVYGWIFAGLATSFYIGNIFGSHKAAKKYNKKLDNEVYNKALHIMLDDF